MEYPYAKHALSYGRANHVSCISLLFLTPWCILDGRVEFIVLYCMTNMMKKQQVRTNLSFLFYSILFTFFWRDGLKEEFKNGDWIKERKESRQNIYERDQDVRCKTADRRKEGEEKWGGGV